MKRHRTCKSEKREAEEVEEEEAKVVYFIKSKKLSE